MCPGWVAKALLATSNKRSLRKQADLEMILTVEICVGDQRLVSCYEKPYTHKKKTCRVSDWLNKKRYVEVLKQARVNKWQI